MIDRDSAGRHSYPALGQHQAQTRVLREWRLPWPGPAAIRRTMAAFIFRRFAGSFQLRIRTVAELLQVIDVP